jgi:hypothetical protein
MKTYGEWRYRSTYSTLVLGGGEWSATLPRDRAFRTHWIGGWMDLKSAVKKTEISCFCHESNPISRSSISWSSRYREWPILGPNLRFVHWHFLRPEEPYHWNGLPSSSCWLLVWHSLRPLKWTRMFLLNVGELNRTRQCCISENGTLIVTAVRTSNAVGRYVDMLSVDCSLHWK